MDSVPSQPTTPESSQSMIFQNGWLLLRRLTWIDQANRDGITQIFYEGSQPETTLYRFDDDGEASGATTARTAQIAPQNSWSFKPKTALFQWPVNPDKPGEVLVALGDVDLRNCADAKSDRHAAFRKALIREVFVGQDQSHFFPQDFLSILYVEPSVPLLSAQASHEDVLEVIQQLRIVLGQTQLVAIPQRFNDLLVFPGALGPQMRADVLVIRIAPMQRRDQRYSLPNSVLALARAMSVVPDMKAFYDRMQSMRMLQGNPGGYLQTITDDLEPRSSRLAARRDKHLEGLYKRHLRERADGADTFRKARELAEEHAHATSAFATNARNSDDDWLWTSEVLSNSKHRYGVIASLSFDLKRAGERIDHTVAELEVRERTASEYLRDYFNAEVARSNIGLQRTVFRLSVIAVIIALFALILQVLPLLTSTLTPAPSQIPPVEKNKVCFDKPIPFGWVLIDKSQGHLEGCDDNHRFNILDIQRIDNRSAGEMLIVCLGNVPPGWELLGENIDKTKCGWAGGTENNIMNIKKK